jgi:hypothetical protein
LVLEPLDVGEHRAGDIGRRDVGHGHLAEHRLEVEVAREEELGRRDELVELADPLLDQRQHGPQVVLVEPPRDRAVGELVDRQLVQVLLVEPGQLVEVEHRAAERDPVPREHLDHLLQRELLAVAAERPAHRAEEVEQRLGQDADVAVVVDRHRLLALADLGLVLVGVAQERHVMEPRRLPAERPVQQDVLLGRRDPLLGADHVADLHQVIVDHVGEVVGRQAVGLEQHLVVDLGGVARDVAAQLVAERDRAGHRDLEPDDVGLAGRGAPGALGRVEVAAVAVVAQRALLGLLLDPDLGEPVLGAEAAIGLAALDQDARVRAIDLAALALAIRGERPAYIGTFIPRQADPVKRVEDQLLGVGARPRLIGVLDAQHERAALLASEHVIEQRDVRGPDVGVTGRRWCDPHTHRVAGGRHGAPL